MDAASKRITPNTLFFLEVLTLLSPKIVVYFTGTNKKHSRQIMAAALLCDFAN